jgi:hypothetical protein
VQVLPPLPSSRQLGGGGQSQAHGGQSMPSGQTSGQAQAQPSGGRRVQNAPSVVQVAPGGQSEFMLFTQSQALSAVQLVSSPCARQASIVWQAPLMHGAPTAQAMPSGIHSHEASAPQLFASVRLWQGSPAR